MDNSNRTHLTFELPAGATPTALTIVVTPPPSIEFDVEIVKV